MVKIAEETGTLDEVMQALSDHYAREDAIMHSIRSAVAYPAVMAGMMIAVIIIASREGHADLQPGIHPAGHGNDWDFPGGS